MFTTFQMNRIAFISMALLVTITISGTNLFWRGGGRDPVPPIGTHEGEKGFYLTL